MEVFTKFDGNSTEEFEKVYLFFIFHFSLIFSFSSSQMFVKHGKKKSQDSKNVCSLIEKKLINGQKRTVYLNVVDIFAFIGFFLFVFIPFQQLSVFT